MIAAASPAFVTVSVGDLTAIVSHDTARRTLRSPARTKRRWTRDHRRVMRERARRA